MAEANKSVSEVEALKIPPHSVEAEQSVLGSIMFSNNAWDAVSDKLQEKDFYRYEHRLIFRSMTKLAEKNTPIDVLTLADSLKAVNELGNVGGDVYLFDLANNTPSAANAGAYADIVRERSVLRQLISAANDIEGTAFKTDGRDALELLDSAERAVFQISQSSLRGQGPQDISALLSSTVEKIDKLHQSDSKLTGLETGFTDFDDMTSGLQSSDLIIVAGRPSMGKTVLGINMAEHAAIRSGKPVLVFSMEMPADSIAMRLISSLARIEQHRVRTGKLNDDDWPRLSSAVSVLSETKLFVDDTPALSPIEVRARARRLTKEHGQLGLIVIDYLQLMQVPGNKENRTAEISEISRSLKALAKELDVPVVALSQLNRSLEQRSDRRPIMSDLRESGAIEQDADVIAFIYRDEVYDDNSPDKGVAEIIIAKQRNGPIGKIRLSFLGHYTKFENLTTAHEYTS